VLSTVIADKLDLSGAIMPFLQCNACSFVSTDLSKTILTNANFVDTNMTACLLIEADLRAAGLLRSDLSHSNLTQANLTNSKLIRCKLNQASLRQIQAPNSFWHLSSLIATDRSQADVVGADMIGADFTRANLTNANVSQTKFDEANFSDCKTQGANFDFAHAKNATYAAFVMAQT
jgi:uncharacterized protein YjbI with pentapeptide repeats